MRAIVAGFLVCAGVLSACGEKKADETTAPTQPAAETVTPPPRPTPEPPTAEEIPIPEDFADQVTQEITPENYAAELDRIATAIDTELAAEAAE